MRLAYFDCFAGASGDMIIASLLDCGLRIRDLNTLAQNLGLKGVKLSSREVSRQGMRARQFTVNTEKAERFKNLAEIEKRLSESKLEAEIKENSLRIFNLIAASEAKVHGLKKARAHFHELGDCDTIVDVVGSLWGLKKLGIERVYASPLPLGKGVVSTEHGTMPLPAPATAEILKKYPVTFSGIHGEWTTPTGAAILSILSAGTEIPSTWTIEKIGYGAGANESEIPNILRLFIGRRENPAIRDEVSIIETNIDNMDPQGYELLMERLFNEGAYDVFITNIIMKKGRPGQKVSVISPSDRVNQLSGVILANTSTLGVRIFTAERKKLLRREKSVVTGFGRVRYKEVEGADGETLRFPEADDVTRIARSNCLPYQKIYKKILDIIEQL